MANGPKTLFLWLLLKRAVEWGRAKPTSPANSLLLLVIREIKRSKAVSRIDFTKLAGYRK